MEEFSGGIENLILGDNQETTQENQEALAARVKAVQIKLQKIKKDESKNKSFDTQLAQILPKLNTEDILFIGNLIDMDVPSITILALISFYVPDAKTVCQKTFDAFIAEHADFNDSESEGETQEKIEFWWTYILAANHMAQEKLSVLRESHTSLETILDDFIQKMYTFARVSTPHERLDQRHAFYMHLLFQ